MLFSTEIDIGRIREYLRIVTEQNKTVIELLKTAVQRLDDSKEREQG